MASAVGFDQQSSAVVVGLREFLNFKNFLTIEHVPRITDFYSCVYVLGCKLCVVRLGDSDFGITPVYDITFWITCTALLLLLLLLLYDMDVSCHRLFLPGTSLEPAVIPTAQASSFTPQYFPYYV